MVRKKFRKGYVVVGRLKGKIVSPTTSKKSYSRVFRTKRTAKKAVEYMKKRKIKKVKIYPYSKVYKKFKKKR